MKRSSKNVVVFMLVVLATWMLTPYYAMAYDDASNAVMHDVVQEGNSIQQDTPSVVDATYGGEQLKSASMPTVIDVTYYGAKPNSHEDAAAPVQRAIAAAAAVDGPVVLHFPEGRYDFYAEDAEKRPYYISNTASESENPDVTKTIGLLLKDMKQVTVEGNGSLFMLHGKMTTFVIDQSEDIEIRNVRVDYERPTMSEVKVLEIGSDYMDVEVNQDSLYEIRGGQVYWVSEPNKAGARYWEFKDGIAQEYDPDQNITWRTGNPVSSATSVQELKANILRLHYNQAPNTAVGHVFQIRDGVRSQVGSFIHKSKNVTWKHVTMHYTHGLGIIGQFSENLTFEDMTFSPRTETGRTATGFADFIQASGVKGKLKIVNSTFRGAHDDVINVHGTHLEVVRKPAPNQIVVRFMHHQTYGFEAFFPGDAIEFIDNRTLTSVGSGKVAQAARINDREITLTLEEDVPSSIGTGVVIENATWAPEVEIKGNHFSRIPTRGILLSTRGKSIIEDNVFERMQMSGILIASDAQTWYESGMVQDVTIRNNTFIENGNPVIQIHPENTKYAGPVHRNINIEGNTFRMLDNTVLFAKSTDGIRLSNNKITRTHPNTNPNEQVAFHLLESNHISIEGNQFEGEGVNRTVLLDRTPADEVTISPEQQLHVNDKGVLKSISIAAGNDQTTLKATASSEATQYNGDAKYAIDGNPSTFWHSQWVPYAPLPQSITLELSMKSVVSGLSYLPRQEGYNGNITAYKIYASTDGAQFTEIASGNWSSDSSEKSVAFPPVTASFIRLEATEGVGGFASAAEVSLESRVERDYTVGQSFQLGVKGTTVGGYAADLTKAVITYSSDNPTIARIDNNGVVTGLQAGTANLTATVKLRGNVVEQTIPVTFKPQQGTPVERIIVTGHNGMQEITAPFATLLMQAKLEPQHADKQAVEWKAYNPGTTQASHVAAIDSNGLLTAKANGIVEVRAEATDGSGVYGKALIAVSGQMTLHSAWTWIRENKEAWSLDAEHNSMKIKTEKGNLWRDANLNKNILLYAPSTEDVTLITQLTFKPTKAYAEGGLLVYGDDDNYFYVARKNHPGYGGAIISVISESNGAPQEQVTADQIQSDTVYLKVTKEGNRYTGYYSTNLTTWTQVGGAYENATIANLHVGLFANNAGGSSGEYGDTAEFQDFRLNDSIVPFTGYAVNPSSLKDAIMLANTIYQAAKAGAEPGQYPQKVIDELRAAIEAAAKVAHDAGATQQEVNIAVVTLMEALDTFHSGVILGRITAIRMNDQLLADFASDKTSYHIELPVGTVEAPIVSAETNDPRLRVSVIQALELPGTAVIRVMNEDFKLLRSYSLRFKTAMVPEPGSPSGGSSGGSSSNGSNGTSSGSSGSNNGSGNQTGTGEGSASGSTRTKKIALKDISGHWAQAAIEQAVEQGIVTGYIDSTFRPNERVTRVEFAAMLSRALKLDGGGSKLLDFTDLDKIPFWARPYVTSTVTAGIITGYSDHTFRASHPISRTEMIVMIIRALGLKADSQAQLPFADAGQIPVWAREHVSAAHAAGFIRGQQGNKLAPNNPATRAEAVTLLVKAISSKH